MNKLFEIIILSIEVLVIFTLFFGLPFFLLNHQGKIEKRYGFSDRTPDLKFTMKCHIEVLMVWNIKAGGAFDKAGFKKGDIILEPMFTSVPRFHKTLDQPKGTIFKFIIIPRNKFLPKCDFDTTGKTEIRILTAP